MRNSSPSPTPRRFFCCQRSASVTNELSAFVFTLEQVKRIGSRLTLSPSAADITRQSVVHPVTAVPESRSCQAPWAVKHAHCSVRMPTHPHLGLDVMIALPVPRNLEYPAVQPHAVSLPTVRFLLTQNVVQVTEAGQARRPTRPCANSALKAGRYTSRRYALAASMSVKVPSHAGLVRTKGPLRAPPGLRGVGRYHLNAQLLKGPDRTGSG